MFSCEYCEIFKNSIFHRTTPDHYTFPKFYMMIELFGRLWVQNWNFSYFSGHCFVFLHNSIRISIPLLFLLVFIAKYLVSVTFVRITILIKSLKFRNNPELQWLLLVIYCENCEYEFFEYYALLLFFFRNGLARNG